MSDVTVYIPCHNAAHFLPDCLRGLLSQSPPPAEILVVDDGSTDATVEVAERFGVRVVRLPGHRGLAAARNAAIEAARHPFLASLDADCVPDTGWLEHLRSHMDEAGVAGAGGMLLESHRDTLADQWRAVHMRQNWGSDIIVNPPFLFGCNTLFDKRALEDAGRYDERFRTNGEDVDISIRLMGRGHTLIYDPWAIVRHLKKDTVLSVLGADRRWGYMSSGETEKFRCNSRIVYHNFTNAKYRFLLDLSARRYRLLPIDALLLFVHTYLDLRYAQGLPRPRSCARGIRSRVDTLTSFHEHLRELSATRFLRNPDSLSSNVSEGGAPPRKILFALFGAMGDIFNALPVVKALRKKYPDADITWLTLPRYRDIAECPWVDRVITSGSGRHGNAIPAEIIDRGEYDMVFFPQGSFNHDEWIHSGLHMTDFMALKCGVSVTSRAPEVRPRGDARERIDALWREKGLAGRRAVVFACGALSSTPWPAGKFRTLAERLGLLGVAVLQIGGEDDEPLAGALDLRGLPLTHGIEAIRRADLFVGCDSGPAWMACCTDTPIVVFVDKERQTRVNVGFARVMPEKKIVELSTGAAVDAVMETVCRKLGVLPAGGACPRGGETSSSTPAPCPPPSACREPSRSAAAASPPGRSGKPA